MINCSFTSNNADQDGGGLYNRSSSPTLTNCVFSNNNSKFGGGLYNYFSTLPKLENCIFNKNNANFNGGGMFNYESSPEVINSTFNSNSAGVNGGGMDNNNNSFPTIKNSIFWGNSASTLDAANIFNSSSTPSFSHSIIEGSGGSIDWNDTLGIDEGNNLDTDPLFTNTSDPDGADNILGTPDDGLIVSACSPAIDAGEIDDTTTSLIDITGNPRIVNELVDIGPYELQSSSHSSKSYVNVSATGRNNGTSWEDAFTDLQLALDACADTIWLAGGTYTPSASPDGSSEDSRDRAFHLAIDKQIYGGFAGNESSLSERNITTNPTILSGNFGEELDDDIREIVDDETETIYHVFITANLSNASIVDGFRIEGGNANGDFSTLSFDGQTFSRNRGGGIYNSSSSPTLINCTFSMNSTGLGGGGIHNDNSSPILTNCVFIRNSSNFVGGGLYNVFSSPTLINCIFSGNSARTNGGGIYNDSSLSTISNCTFSSNSANEGGGMYNASSTPIIKNSIIWGNTASVSGANLFNPSIIKNSIIEGSGGSDTWDINFGTDEGNNLDRDPLFTNRSDPDGVDNILGTTDDGLIVSVCSPAIDAGEIDDTTTSLTDITGNPRIVNGLVDIGAYELQSLGHGVSSSTISLSVSNQYITPSGKVWTTSRTENDTIPNAIGCDSIITINLTIIEKIVAISDTLFVESIAGSCNYILNNINDNDTIPGDLLNTSWRLIDNPVNGSASISGTSIIYTTFENTIAFDSVRYESTFDNGIFSVKDTAYVYFSIRLPSVPILSADTVDSTSFIKNELIVNILNNDIVELNNAMNITITQDPFNGKARVINTNDSIQIGITPNSFFYDLDSLQYTINYSCTDISQTAWVYYQIGNNPPIANRGNEKFESKEISIDIGKYVYDKDNNLDMLTLITEPPATDSAEVEVQNNLLTIRIGYPTIGRTDSLFLDSIQYKICDTEQECDSNWIIYSFEVDRPILYNALSPNGDGFNDKLIIGNIDLYTYRNVQIYNRNNEAVYNEEGYDNEKVVWDGRTPSGKLLNPGSYLCLVKYGRSRKKNSVISKYVLLKSSSNR